MIRLIAPLAALIIVIALCTRTPALGSMSMMAAEEKTASSDISFECKAGDRVKIQLSQDAENGDVDFVLTDSTGTIVAEFDKARELETYVDLNKDDTYTLIAEYEDFKGDFSAKVINV